MACEETGEKITHNSKMKKGKAGGRKLSSLDFSPELAKATDWAHPLPSSLDRDGGGNGDMATPVDKRKPGRKKPLFC